MVQRLLRKTCIVSTAAAAVLAAAAGSCGTTDSTGGPTTYSATVTGSGSQVNTSTSSSVTVTCTYTMSFNGIYTIRLPESSSGMYSGATAGSSTLSGTVTGGAPTVSGTNGASGSCPAFTPSPQLWTPAVTGSASTLAALEEHNSGNGVVSTLTFNGSLGNGKITGAVTIALAGQPTGGANVNTNSGSITIPVALTP